MSLVARCLEERGIATVVVGSARDVVEQCGVPRFLFSDFPLGNPCGRPWDRPMQAAIVRMALDLLESAVAPRTTVQTPYRWSDDESWRDNYMRVDAGNRRTLARLGAERRRRRGVTEAASARRG